ncbi:BnaC02g13660D [Brassica napus]|uniref:BnaC02g13660D protein n=1 Tax=Brassica napus TaxID=3708 RepID=A0A078HTA2_BRANA|nr:BnaC02g13660D [Brassica napus]
MHTIAPSQCHLRNPNNTTLTSLYYNGRWLLPPARSEAQVNLQVLIQMQALSSRSPLGMLTLLCWQSCMYWIWSERNSQLHRQQPYHLLSLDAAVANLITLTASPQSSYLASIGF